MQKIIALSGAIIVIMVSLFLWRSPMAPVETSNKEAKENNKKITVVTTFYPLADFARSVGGERVIVTSVVPAGTEPHDYEPTQRDIVSAYEADIFLLNGAGFDPWAEKIRPELEARGVRVVQMSEMVTLLPGTHEEDGHGEEGASEHEEGEEESHEEEVFDPHFWLDPLLVEKQVNAITSALIALDAGSQSDYVKWNAEYLMKLQALDATYRSDLKTCDLRTVVTSHNAFGYLAKRYQFDTIAVSGLSSEDEPSPRRLAEVATLVKERGIKHIFFETLVSPKIAETLAQETGTTTLLFNPIEGLTAEEEARGENYLSIMQSNLENLKIALQCQTR